MRYPKLFEKGQIGNINTKNRIVMPPMGTNMANENGAVTPSLIEYYKERAKGGTGLIIVEVSSVSGPQGNAIVNELNIHDNAYVSGHSELVEAVKEHGSKIVIQLHHAGRQTAPDNTRGLEPVGPSAIPDPHTGVVPRELTQYEIEEIIDDFEKAAVRAQNAGYDGVEIHGAHGYLVGQFMSPFSNKRNDLYGGNLHNRMRFPLEIIKRVKEATSEDFTVLFRLSAEEFVEDGVHLEEAKNMARILQESGIDAIDVSSGNYASMSTILETMDYPEAWRAYLAENIKKVVNIPVITVGVIRNPETAENLLNEGKADYIAVGRTLIADPEWPKKALQNRPQDIRKCITCNIWCIGERLFNNLSLRCTVNATSGRELEFPKIPEAASPGNYTVVGGGPAGMEAARVLAAAGHTVTLYERSSELGGQIKLACVPPGKEKIKWSTDYLEEQMRKLKVDVHINTEITADMLEQTDTDGVIIATGAAPIIPDIPGSKNPNVTTSWDILEGRYEVGERVAIVGGGNVGCETALFLNQHNKEVIIIEQLDELATDAEPISRAHLLDKLAEAGINIMTGYSLKEIKHDGIVALDKLWREHWVPCSHVVLSIGAQPINNLDEELRKKGLKSFMIGDAKEPGKLNHAIRDGFLTAYRINQAHTFESEDLIEHLQHIENFKEQQQSTFRHLLQ